MAVTKIYERGKMNMKIAKIINENAKKFSPYLNTYVNHLPMGQLALFKITSDIEKVAEFTKHYLETHQIEPIKKEYKQQESIENCLGKRELYMPCLDLIREKMEVEGVNNTISAIINKYPLALSSGLFHTTIRLAYAVEGYKLDKELKEEIARALSYYVTGYRKGAIFKRKIAKEEAYSEMEKLMNEQIVKETKELEISRNNKIKKLYQSPEFLKLGFVIEGSPKDKVEAILQILIPAFYNSNSIVMLHTITGLHATIVLKEYFDDYEYALDVLTSTALTHILTQEGLSIKLVNTKLDESFTEVVKSASNSTNVHTIKIAYSCQELDKNFQAEGLKYAINNRRTKEI